MSHLPSRAKPGYQNAGAIQYVGKTKGELTLARPDEDVRVYMCGLEVKADLSRQRARGHVVRPAER